MLGGATARPVLELLDERQRAGRLRAHLLAAQRPRLPVPATPTRTCSTRSSPPGPSAERIEALDERLAATPPFRGLRVTDGGAALRLPRRRRALSSSTSTSASRGSRRTYDGVYSRLLRRLLIGDDVAVRPPEDALPLRLRDRRARARRARARQRGRLPALAPRRPPAAADRDPGRGPASPALDGEPVTEHRPSTASSSERYFPGAVGARQLAAPARPRRADLPPRLRADAASTASCSPAEATIVSGAPETPPYLLKTIAPLRHPAEVMVLIDADIVVTRPLAPADPGDRRPQRGRVQGDDVDRFFGEWGRAARPRARCGRGPTSRPASSVLAGDRRRRAARASGTTASSRVDFERSWFARRRSRLPVPLHRPGRAQRDPLRPSPSRARSPCSTPAWRPTRPSAALRIVDEATLRCAYRDGIEPFVLHQYLSKPWLEPMYHGLYSRLLEPAAGWADDVAVRVPRARGPAADARRAPSATAPQAGRLQDLARWYVRDVIPEWVAARRGVARERTGPQRDRRGASTASPTSATSSARSALVNSLRLLGHAEPVFVLDCGLTRRPARAARARGDRGRGARGRAALAAEDGRAASPPGRGDGADRRRHGRHALARRR